MAIANSKNSLVILQNEIHQVDGLYSLNDLHKASGGQPKNKPLNFLRLQQAIDLVNEIEHCSDMNSALKVVNGGNNRGTYACKQLVIAYAAWISPAVNLAVIDAFLEKQEASPFKIPQTFAEAMLLGAQQAKELEKVKCEVIELKPKADALNRIAESDGSLTLTDAAKTLQVPPRKFNAWLGSHNWIYRRVGNQQWTGYQPKLDAQYLHHKTETVKRDNCEDKTYTQVRVTPKGLVKLGELMFGGAQ